MHFLARLLRGDVAVSEELSRDEQLLHTELERFFKSYQIKENVLQHLQRGEPIAIHLHKLHFALAEEIKVIEQTEHTEHEILMDLKYLSREHYIRVLEALSRELNSAETRDRYLHHLLSELHDTLMSEARKVRRLLHGEHDLDLTETLIDLLTIERHLVEKLTVIEDFHKLFGDLFSGTKRRAAIESAKIRLKKRVELHMRNIQTTPNGTVTSTDDHYLSELTARVMNKLEDAVMTAVQSGLIEHHPQVDIEYVQSPLFVRFVQQELEMDKRLGKLTPSLSTMQAFIATFREIYVAPQEVMV